jgi:hypothetical protein
MDATRPKMDYEGLLEFAEINSAHDGSDRRRSQAERPEQRCPCCEYLAVQSVPVRLDAKRCAGAVGHNMQCRRPACPLGIPSRFKPLHHPCSVCQLAPSRGGESAHPLDMRSFTCRGSPGYGTIARPVA